MADRTLGSSGEIAFGPFRLVPAQQLLLQGEQPIRLGSRAREILAALLERPGDVISKEELVARVWPDTIVEEGNLKVHIAGLRRALGDDGRPGHRYIANVPGRGYSFVGTVSSSGHPPAGAEARPERSPRPAERSKEPLERIVRTRIFGRSATVEGLKKQLLLHRFITLVGPGGIGKTTVALAAGDELADTLPDGVHFVDFSLIKDQQLVPTALGSVLGVPVHSEGSLQNITAFLRDKQSLIVLDNCEHVIEAAAAMAEELLAKAKGTLVLATSREPLRAAGEYVHRLAPLDAPPESDTLSAAEALNYPAVQLFVERAAASLEGFTLTDSEAPIVAETCRRLDGLALAIELTASRIDAFGVGGLAAVLNDRFGLLRGRRTALPRHQTLGATLDWSYVLLSEPEQVVLRRLGVFAGSFMMNAASALLADNRVSASQVVYCVANLVAKSFVAASINPTGARYRLLDTTRAYARSKLDENGEAGGFARRHAIYCQEELAKAETEWEKRPAAEWILDHRQMIDDVRTALDWAFSPSGDGQIGVDLTIAALPLWFQLSLIGECQGRVERALTIALSTDDTEPQMRLYAALGWSLMQTRSVSEAREAWTNVLRFAEGLDNVDYQLRALWGLWAGMLNRCELAPALALANRFYDLAERQADSADLFVGDRMIGYILHLLGDQNGARRHIERMLSGYVTPVIGAEVIRYVFDQRVTARCFLARIIWLQGFPDQASRLVENIVQDAMAGNDTLSICQALVQAACPVAIFTGDVAKLETYVDMLLDHAERNSFGFFSKWGHGFKGVLLVRKGDVPGGLAYLRRALADLRSIDYGVYYITFLGELAEALGRSGESSRGILEISHALKRAAENHEFWYIAELLRIKGELLLQDDKADAISMAEASFAESLEWARRHQTTSWELRSALSLARLFTATGRAEEGRSLLESVFCKFTEGHQTADLALAAAMLGTTR